MYTLLLSLTPFTHFYYRFNLLLTLCKPLRVTSYTRLICTCKFVIRFIITQQYERFSIVVGLLMKLITKRLGDTTKVMKTTQLTSEGWKT